MPVETDYLGKLFDVVEDYEEMPPVRQLVPVTPEVIRKAGSVAFFELKKHKLYEIKEQDDLTTVHLFGDNYIFHFDRKKKMAWAKSQHHYQNRNSFKLFTSHKDWEGIFSFPRSLVCSVMNQYITDQGMKIVDPKKLGVQYKIVAIQAYNASKNKLAKIIGGVLWKAYDREIAKLASRIFNIGCDALDYSLIWNNKEEFTDTAQKAAGILPIWKKIIEYEMTKDWTRNNVFDYNYCEENLCFPDIIKMTKNFLEGRGLTGEAWRYLVKMPPRFVNKMAMFFPIGSFIPFINWMAYIGVVPRYSLLINFLKNREYVQGDFRTEDAACLFRAAFTAALKCRRGIREFWDQQILPTLDWFHSGEVRGVHVDQKYLNNSNSGRTGRLIGQVALDKNQRKASWDWFMRQQEEWHRTVGDNIKKGLINEQWDSAIPQITVKGYDVVPLITSYELIDEGKSMHHCVGSYVKFCKDGQSRIFSIRKNGRRLATLELSLYNVKKKFWEVSQLRGSCNSDPGEAIKAVANKVATMYTKAYNEL